MVSTMKAAHIYLLLHVLSTVSVLVNAFDPITTTVVIGVAAFFWGTFYHHFHENCDPRWIAYNATVLQADLESKVIGQHVASPIILKAVNGFMSIDNPKKSLVLFLHGPTGTGKTFVSKLIAENIYKEGMNSRFVHVFISTLHFPHSSQTNTYKSQLKQWIKGNITDCAQSMFIFDEVDKMHPDLIDSIKPYLDYYNKVDEVSYGKAIFIFLSNDGAESITQTALDFWNAGRDRKEIELKDLETSLSVSAFNIKSGLWRSSFTENLVDFFIPFLPLEYQHVVQCARAQMKARGLEPDQDVADEVAGDLDYFPKFERVFSVRGCKTVESRLHFYTK
ncbi:torsin-1A-like isoform X1 [Thunnus albacares]|uniref:torsin-1A-like isoform X1 n=1 Tax=Thunnus albacares TaxID=8236 RepID=UPI001CF70E2A|nr:torsin-1A-like isoform X1 [Thunnus albacares]